MDATNEAVEHKHAFNEFNQNLRADQSDQVDAWVPEHDEWDRAPLGRESIFDTKVSGLSPPFIPDICTDLVF